MSNQLWDREASLTETEGLRAEFLRNLFLKIVNKGISYTNGSSPLRVLKTDLWNESVSTERDILSAYTNDKFEVYGIDISNTVCSNVKNKKIKVFQGDIKQMPFETEFFDVVLDLSTLDHVKFEEIEKPLGEYHRILKKDGVLVLIFDSWGAVWKLYNFYLRKSKKIDVLKFAGTDIVRQYNFNPGKVKKIVSGKFDILDQYSIDLLGWSWNRFTVPAWKKTAKTMYDFIYKLELSKISKYLTAFGKQYVVIARKK